MTDAVRLGATGDNEGLYVEVEPGFGTNVYIGLRIRLLRRDRPRYEGHEYVDSDKHRLGLSLRGWEHLCELVDEYRERGMST